jgi:hypothetical protein
MTWWNELLALPGPYQKQNALCNYNSKSSLATRRSATVLQHLAQAYELDSTAHRHRRPASAFEVILC